MPPVAGLRRASGLVGRLVGKRGDGGSRVAHGGSFRSWDRWTGSSRRQATDARRCACAACAGVIVSHVIERDATAADAAHCVATPTSERLHEHGQRLQRMRAMVAALARCLLPFLFIFAIAGYVIGSFFLMRIFEKAGVQGKWRAWVPVYNFMVFAKLGDLSPWVMLGAIVRCRSCSAGCRSSAGSSSLAALAACVIAAWRVGLKLRQGWPYLLLWLIPGLGALIWLGILAFDKSPWNPNIAPVAVGATRSSRTPRSGRASRCSPTPRCAARRRCRGVPAAARATSLRPATRRRRLRSRRPRRPPATRRRRRRPPATHRRLPPAAARSGRLPTAARRAEPPGSRPPRRSRRQPSRRQRPSRRRAEPPAAPEPPQAVAPHRRPLASRRGVVVVRWPPARGIAWTHDLPSSRCAASAPPASSSPPSASAATTSAARARRPRPSRARAPCSTPRSTPA